ncbi:MAG TPA: glycosyltransferase family 4 protein [Polyangiaceae bacterium]|nr:glycosyltransferase family 4 protein [Polyangiaceae bacterium]
MSERPIAYVMEQTLGSITHYLNLRREESASEDPKPLWIPIEHRQTRVPWTLTASWLTRLAVGAVLNQIDGIFMHTTTLAPLSLDYFGKKPTVLSTDGTPLNKRDMRRLYGLKDQGRLGERAKRAMHRQVFRSSAGLVAWSHWTKQSFIEDYGCREEDVAVIAPGINLDDFSIGDRNHELPRILFVGGDFERKGGDLLLDVFRKRLRGRAELILVTRGEVSSEPGVAVHRNVSANSKALQELYRSSDIFALPTRADCFSLVCMEAQAAGLPTITTRVGGIPDLIEEGETGHLLKPGDTTTLGDALEALVLNPSRRLTMSKNSRAAAVKRFDSHANARQLFEFVRSRC